MASQSLITRALLLTAVTCVGLSCDQSSGGGVEGPIRVNAAALTDVDDCEGLEAISQNLSGTYRLAADIDCTGFDAGDNQGFEPIGDVNAPFTGSFDGDGHSITGLSITLPSRDGVGLFGTTNGALLERVALLGVEISGRIGTGPLVGAATNTTVRQSYSSGGTVNGTYDTGGLVGGQYQGGTVTDCYASVSVSGQGDYGLLVGWVEGSVQRGYGSGTLDQPRVGTICEACSNPTIEDSFFDCEVAGDCTAEGATTTTAMSSLVTFTDAGWDFNSTWGSSASPGYPCLRWQAGCGCVAGIDSDGDGATDCDDQCVGDSTKTAPGVCGCGIPDVDSDGDGTLDCNDPCPEDSTKVQPGVCGCNEPDADADNDGSLNCNDPDWPHAVRDCAELQAMREHLDRHYRLVLDIDCTGFDVGDGLGFEPVGDANGAFTGSLDGDGHTVAGLTIDRPSRDGVGLFGTADGALFEKIGLIGVDIAGHIGSGALVGAATNTTVHQSYSSGAVTGYYDVGGLVGGQYSGGSVTDSYAAVAVSRSGGDAGLLVGWVEGSVDRGYATGTTTEPRVGTICESCSNPTIEDSFYDCDVAGDCSADGATSTAAMSSTSTYTDAGWDFQTVWGTHSSSVYPCLRWEDGCTPNRNTIPNLIGYWGFDEASGNTALDSSGVAAPSNGTISNATRDTHGRSGGALYFNGTNALVAIPDGTWNVATATPVTYSFWYKVDGTPKGAVIDHRLTSVVPGAWLYNATAFSGASYDSVSFASFDNTSTNVNVVARGPESPGVWMMATVVISSTNVALYKNGVQIGSLPLAAGHNFPRIPGNLYVGSRGEVPDQFFKGWIDELAVYGRALTSTEVTTLYESYGPAPTLPWAATGLVGQWNFDDASGTVAADSSGYGVDGSLLGGAAWDPNGVSGSCIRFNGTDSLVRIPDGVWDQHGNMTYTLWYKLDPNPGSTFIGDHEAGSNIRGIFAFRTNHPGFSAYDADRIDRPTSMSGFYPTPPANEWRMLTVVFTPTEHRVYSNGTFIGSGPLSGGGIPYYPGRLIFGGRGSVGDQFLRGWIDEVSIYARALTDTQIHDLYAAVPLPAGHTCIVDADCNPGLRCGFGIGPKFGKSINAGVCWDPIDCAMEVPTACGHVGDICGSDCCVPECGAAAGTPDGCGHTCAACVPGADSDGDGLEDCDERSDAFSWTNPLVSNPDCGDGVLESGEACDPALTADCSADCTSQDSPTVCSTDADCAVGQACGTGNGTLLGQDALLSYCWPREPCSKNPALSCGASDALCGFCIGARDCATKNCGDDADDGHGGVCTGFCDPREAGCRSDSDCTAGYFCGIGAGARFGLGDGVNVCIPNECNDYVPSRMNCGTTSSACGECPATAAFVPPDTCDPNCAPGLYCSTEGTCRPREATLKPSKPSFPSEAPMAEVGSLPGSFSVTDSGAAAYTLPIEVPPGRAGVQPSLALHYDSSTGDGYVARGWSVTGLPAITRCPKTYASNNEVSSVRGTMDDRYCLDGQQLVVVNGAPYGSDGAEYRTELDTFTKVTSYGSSLTLTGDAAGPDHFEARTKDGKIFHYGTLPGSRRTSGNVALVWYVSEIEDHSHNSLRVYYEQWERETLRTFAATGWHAETDVQENRPAAIYYTYHNDERASRKVVFHYDDTKKNMMPRRFMAGVPFRASSPLDRIETYIENQLVRTYKLNTRAVGATWLLDGVQLCVPSSSGERCIPQTRFTYQETGDQLAPPAGSEFVGHIAGNGLWSAGASAKASSDRSRVLGGGAVAFDFNGDGADDLLQQVPTDVDNPKYRWVLRQSRKGVVGGRFFEDPVEPAVTDAQDNGDYWKDLRDVSAFTVLDFNEDGRADLYGTDANGHVYIFVSTGLSSFRRILVDILVHQKDYPPQQHGLIDLDGDGRLDYAQLYSTGSCHSTSTDPYNACDQQPYHVLWRRNLGPGGGLDAQLGPLTEVLTVADGGLIDTDYNGSLELALRPDLHSSNGSIAFISEPANEVLTRPANNVGFWSLPAVNPSDPTMSLKLDANGDGLIETVSMTLGTCSGIIGYGPAPAALQMGWGLGDISVASLGSIPPAVHVLGPFDYFINGATDAHDDPMRPSGGCEYRAPLSTFIMDRDNDGRDELYVAPGPFGGDSWSELDPVGDHGEPWPASTPGFLPFVERGPTGRLSDLNGDQINDRYEINYSNEHQIPQWRSWQRPVVMDVDGDGVKDLVSRDGDEQNPVMQVRLAQSRTRLLLTAVIDDGMLKRTTVGYDRAATGTNTVAYTRGTSCTYPQRCLKRAPHPVVAESVTRGFAGPFHDSSQPLTPEVAKRFEYAYADGRVDLRGRGFLGFAQRSVKELTATTLEPLSTTVYVYDLDTQDESLRRYWKAGTPTNIVTSVTTAPNLLTNSHSTSHLTTAVYNFALKTSAAGVQYVALLGRSRTTLENFQIVSLMTEDFNFFDGYGNPGTSYRVDGTNGHELTTLTTTRYEDSTTRPDLIDQWLVALPRETTVSSAPNLDDPASFKHIQLKLQDYDARGLPQTLIRGGAVGEVAITEIPEKLRTEIVYDDAGMGNPSDLTLSSVTGAQSSAASPPRGTHVTYDGEGYFPILIQNDEHRALSIPGTTLYHDPRSGRVSYQQDPSGDWTFSEYDGAGRLQWVRDSAGRATDILYALGTRAGGSLEARLASTGEPIVTTEYNSFGQPILQSITRFLNQESRAELGYDELGRLVAEGIPHLSTDASPGATTYLYDALGRVIERKSPWQNELGAPQTASTHYFYVSAGNAVGTTLVDDWLSVPGAATAVATQDPALQITADIRDGRGNVVGASDLVGTVQYTYGAFDYLERASFAGVDTTIKSDETGATTHYSDPQRGSQDYVYNGFGDIEQVTRNQGAPSAQTSLYGYDGLGRQVSATTPDGTYSWLWDTTREDNDGNGHVDANDLVPALFGRLIEESVSSTTIGNNSTTYQYDGPGGAVSAIVRQIDGQSSPFTTSFSYNANALLDTATYPTPTPLRVKYSYNAQGTLTGVADADDLSVAFWTLGHEGQSQAAAVDAFGGIAASTYGNGAQVTQTREARTGMMHSIHATRGGTTLQDETYRYDARGLLTFRGSADGATGQQYLYDSLGRIVSHKQLPGGTPFAYTYDEDGRGNLTSSPTLGGLNYDYPSTPDQVSSTDDGHSYYYNAYGNQDRRTMPDGSEQRLTYTSFDLPVKVTKIVGSQQVGSTDFKYDASGTRVVRSTDAGARTTYIGEIYREDRSESGTTAHTAIVPLPDGGALEIGVDGPTRQYRYSHVDYQGSTVAVSNGAGGREEQRGYLPFGKPVESSWVTTVPNGYTGHQHDVALGLINMRGRMFDPDLGRFLTPDPVLSGLRHTQGHNPYSYVLNSPTNLVDPNGWDPCASSDSADGHFGYLDCRYGPGPSTIPGGGAVGETDDAEGAEDALRADLMNQAEKDATQESNARALDALNNITAWDLIPILPPWFDYKRDAENWNWRLETLINGTWVVVDAALLAYTGLGAEIGPAVRLFAKGGEGIARTETKIAVRELEASGGGGKIVYRGGSRTPDNMTPRPGRDMTGDKRGLSTFDTLEKATPPGGKAQAIDTSKLNCLGAYCSPDGHVSLRPGTQAELEAWGATRGTGNVHEYTQEVLDAVVETVRRPQ